MPAVIDKKLVFPSALAGGARFEQESVLDEPLLATAQFDNMSPSGMIVADF